MKSYSSYVQVLRQSQSGGGFQAVLRSLVLVSLFVLALPLLVLLLGLQLFMGVVLLCITAVRGAKRPSKDKVVWSNGEKVINPM
ncbi:hypothetical protein [Motilimonas sp. KMU-193]|uniref:hypothetical protein n=1 Tax=Motilimonas sp. KMU-193 TaxID=3388668 RepID=UPI00396B2E16